MNRNLLLVIIALLVSITALGGCQTVPTASEDQLTKLEGEITALEERISEKEATIGELRQELEQIKELQAQSVGPRPEPPALVEEVPPTPVPVIISEQPSTGVYDRPSYELITVRPAGNEASFSIRPNQHYSVVFFLDDPPDRDTTVYQTFIPAQAKDNIWVYYTKPLDDHTGVSIGPGRHTFAMLAYFEGWYTIDYYYDVPEGMLASSMSEVGIYVRWEIGG